VDREIVEATEELIKGIIEYFEKHPERRWKLSNKVLTFGETAELIRKDGEFRKKILLMVKTYALDQMTGE
jgi:hypothetical protein